MPSIISIFDTHLHKHDFTTAIDQHTYSCFQLADKLGSYVQGWIQYLASF